MENIDIFSKIEQLFIKITNEFIDETINFTYYDSEEQIDIINNTIEEVVTTFVYEHIEHTEDSLSSYNKNKNIKIKFSSFKPTTTSISFLNKFDTYKVYRQLTILFLIKGMLLSKQSIETYVKALINLVKEKNKKYGSAIINPLPILLSSKELNVELLLKLQMNNKVMRMINNTKEDEDPILDFLGYAVLYEYYSLNKFLK